MNVKPSIKIIFFYLIKSDISITSYKLSFQNIINKISSYEVIYEIPENVFMYGKDKSKIFIELYDSNNQILNKIEFKIYYDFNTVYIQIDANGNGFNFDMIFKNIKELKIYRGQKKFISLDNIGTKDRKKLTILNYQYISLNVNGKTINLKDLTHNYSSNFYQFSINEDYKIIVQTNEIIEQPDLHLIMKKKVFIDNFYKEIFDLLENNDNYENHYLQICSKFEKEIDFVDYNLNFSNNFLDEYFKTNQIDLETIKNYQIFLSFCKFRKKYLKNKKLLQETIKELNKFYNKIKDEINLKIYEKIMVLVKILLLLSSCSDLNSLNKINLKYYIISECDENSIIGKTKKFFNEFVSTLSEESKIFPYFLNLDSGIGYYNEHIVYTFDMSNLKMIKEHLSNLFPRVLLFYYIKNDTLANTNKNITCVAINKFNLLNEFQSKMIDFEKEMKDNVDLAKDMAINLFILILHECTGHLKFSYNRSKVKSPKKFISENNQLLELKRFCDYNENSNNSNEYILDNICKNKGDSGTFCEFAYGKYKRYLITNLILKVNKKGNLLNSVDLFTDKNNEKLKKYIILKYEAKKNDIFIEEKNTVEEEIKEYEKYIDNYQDLVLEKNNLISNEHQILGNKSKRNINENNAEEELFLGVNKKKKLNDDNFIEKLNDYKIIKKEELDEDNKSKNSESKSSDDFSDNMYDDKFYEKMIKKYGFKDDERIYDEIYEKIKDNSIIIRKKQNLHYLLFYLNEVE